MADENSTWTIWKISKLQSLFDQELIEVDRAPDASEADSGIEFLLQGEPRPDGSQLVPARKLRILPILEDGKPHLRFEVEDLPWPEPMTEEDKEAGGRLVAMLESDLNSRRSEDAGT